jgi:hypothetical protein
MTTHFKSGVTNASKFSALGLFGSPSPIYYNIYFNDFNTYTAADWTVTETGSATQATTAGDGGLLLITNAAADNDSTEMQITVGGFTYEASKDLFFGIKFQVNDATQTDIAVGLANIDTTVIDGTNDAVYFTKADGTTSVSFGVGNDGTFTTATGVTTLADATNVELAFAYNSNDGLFHYYIDGTDSGTSVTTNAPDANLSPTIAIQNGATAAKTMTIDYIYAAKKRDAGENS